MGWIKDKVFNNADDFLKWLDAEYGDYIKNHINANHVHHTWAPNHASNKKNSTLQLHKNMRNYHVNTNGWNDIAQNITIGSDGKIVTGRTITVIPVSATGYNGTTNWHPFAYEMIGNFDKGNDVLEGAQLESAIKVSRYFYKKGKSVVFHRECLINGKAPKTCPGTGISKDWFMGLVKDSKYDVGSKVDTSQVKASPSVSVGETNKEPVKSANVLQKGDSGSKVKTLQQALINKGFALPKYGADGDYGDETVSAVKALQKATGIGVDGIYGPASAKALAEYKKPAAKATSTSKASGSAIVPYPGKLIRKGSRGKDVERIQRAVGVKADGIFGSGTEAAVKAYQKRKGLSADGIVGPATWNVMF